MKNPNTVPSHCRAALLALALSAAVPAAFAHTGAKHETPKAGTSISTEETAFGRQGYPGKVTRTIAIDMHDNMRFHPADIRVKQGETIRFVIRNEGKMLHEFVLGTMDELKEHGELMKKHPDMEHDEPYMAHVNPGGKEEIVWQFTKAGEFHYACLIPGHFEAGMIGRIKVRKR